MKKIYVLWIMILSIHTFSQKDYSRYYNSWRLGLNLGGTWQTSDMRNKAGGAGGFTLEKGFLENKSHVFSLAVRGRYLGGSTTGMDYTRNYSIKGNDAYNGAYNPVVNYVDSVPAGRRYVYDNYKTTVYEGALELQVNFNRLRERTHVLVNIWGGVGITSYRTSADLLDAGGKRYDFSKVDSTGKPTTILNSYRSLTDKTYESHASGSKKGNLVTFSPSAGIGLGYQFSPGFSMIAEYKVTFPQGTSADLLDGKVNTNKDRIGGNNDYYHYAGVNFLFTLRGKKKTSASNPETPSAVVTPNTSITPTVINEPKPVISYITPSINGQVTNVAGYRVAAQVLEVKNSSQIQFQCNGLNTANFSFDPVTHLLYYYANLQGGVNTIRITATNGAGSVTKNTTVNYEQPQATGNPPLVTITNPGSGSFNSMVTPYSVVAYVSNVSTRSNISVRQNNVLLTNFNFNTVTGQIDFALPLTKGLNTIVITAVNTYGNDSKSCTVNYALPQQQLPPPVISIINPAQSGMATATQNYTGKAQILNITGPQGASVYINGLSIPFVYDATIKQISFNTNLNPGTNAITIYANNASGDDTKATEIIYNVTRPAGKPPVVNLINPVRSVNATDIGNYAIKTEVLGVSLKNEIAVTVNGTTVTNFNYNPASKEVDVNVALKVGENLITVKGTNPYGSDFKTISVIYKPHVDLKTPPIITFINPLAPKTLLFNSNYIFKATVLNMPNAIGLTVKLNGTNVLKFVYDGFNLSYQCILAEGDNNFEITAVNKDGKDIKSSMVTFQPKVKAVLPVVNLINPFLSESNSLSQKYGFKLSCLNVFSKNDIEVIFNGQPQTAFTYNIANSELDFTTGLLTGNNTLSVKGTNQYGSDSKLITIKYNPKVVVKVPPAINFTQPANASVMAQTNTYQFIADIAHVADSSGLIVKYNGIRVSNYTYNGSSLTYQTVLISGNNTLDITATNPDGMDQETATVSYRQREIVKPPSVTILSPVNQPTVTTDAYEFQFKAFNASKNQLEIFLNGSAVKVFNFSGNVGSFTANLANGQNTLMVKASTAGGSDSKSEVVTFVQPVISPGNPSTPTPTVTPTPTTTPDQPVSETVQICFYPNGPKSTPVTKTIPQSQLNTYLNQGATLGPCPPASKGTSKPGQPIRSADTTKKIMTEPLKIPR